MLAARSFRLEEKVDKGTGAQLVREMQARGSLRQQPVIVFGTCIRVALLVYVPIALVEQLPLNVRNRITFW